MIKQGFLSAALAAASMALSACSSGTSAPAAADGNDERRCYVFSLRLLTREQAGEYVARSGASLVKGTDSYQCSSSEQAGAVLTIIWHPQRAE
jgi:hypothetical protein